ncbi:MAG: hypothetical protein HRU15_07595, partial [Planctomycetes bacterium]|nr:hypothetical protein [Planctomycetota bacterium]
EKTIGYNAQIKHQNARTQLAAGMPISGTTIIRDNTFIKSESRTASGRPNLLLGHFPDSGNGSTDQYYVYQNTFYQNNDDEYLFQGEGNVSLYNNRCINTLGLGLSMQYHNSNPRDVRIFWNTVLTTGTGINISGVDNAYTQKVIANLVFSSGISAADQSQNISTSYANAGNYIVSASGSQLSDFNLLPLINQATGSAVVTSSFNSRDLYNIDFDGIVRGGMYRGAYSSDAGDPSASTDVKINFQPTMAPTVASYEVDSGLVYGNRGNAYTYGWSSNNSSSARDRNSNGDQRQDTLLYFVKNSAKTWSIQLANGDYDIKLVCGDPSYAHQVHDLRIEGVLYADGDGADNFDTINATVTVSDGQLDISAENSATDAKISYIEIQTTVVVNN